MVTPTRRRRTARALTAVLACGLLTAPTPAGATSTIDPIDPEFEQTASCLKDNRALDPLTDGIGWAQRSLGFNAVADLSVGAGVTVAVIDTGVNPQPTFGTRLTGGGDLLWAAAPAPGLADCDGHGTLVAGIIAGAADPATGFTGVAPGARILSIRDTSERYTRKSTASASPSTGIQGVGVGTPEMLAGAIDRSVAAGARVVNVSAAICGPALSTVHPGLEAAVARATAADVLVVAAAGNVGGEGKCSPQNTAGAPPVTAALPARIEAVLTVGAIQPSGAPADFSLIGPWVDVAAPGEEVLSVNPHPDRTGEVDRLVGADGVVPISGTSFAAPYVSGVAALVRARFPGLTAAQVAHRIAVTASHPAGAAGRTDAVGAGVVNPRRALTAVLPEEGSAGTPRSLTEQAAAATTTSATAPPAASSAPARRDDALPPAPASPDPFAGRSQALIGAGALIALLGVGLVQLVLRRRGRSSV